MDHVSHCISIQQSTEEAAMEWNCLQWDPPPSLGLQCMGTSSSSSSSSLAAHGWEPLPPFLQPSMHFPRLYHCPHPACRLDLFKRLQCNFGDSDYISAPTHCSCGTSWMAGFFKKSAINLKYNIKHRKNCETALNPGIPSIPGISGIPDIPSIPRPCQPPIVHHPHQFCKVYRKMKFLTSWILKVILFGRESS